MDAWALAGIAVMLMGYATLAAAEEGAGDLEPVLVILEEMPAAVTWTVALSVYAHSLSAWPGANRYAGPRAPPSTSRVPGSPPAPAASDRTEQFGARGPLSCCRVGAR